MPGMPCKVVAALPLGLEPLDHAIPERPSPSTKSWVAVEALKYIMITTGLLDSSWVLLAKLFMKNPSRATRKGQ